ncbi:MAG: tRNA (adenosine(37)-N6)-dimethylallyltransferase MiaA [Bacteroidaceae bacterium]|nr:tRNA (adenosine(37)-N6)-dimethylallyltransferase MiaA [Bacteroidaceae bacterium]
MKSTPTLIVLLGPTAVGKTALSLDLAAHFGAPVVSADSRQIFRGMEIGTAAPTEAQRVIVEHHFIGVLAPDRYYSAARYEEEATDRLATLFKKHHAVILCGGSMLYIDAVCRGIDNIPTIDDHVRIALRQRLQDEGLDSLIKDLQRLDPDYYATCDLRNTRRVVHALEVCLTAGRPYSTFRTGHKAERPFRIVKIGLNLPRETLFQRIGCRTEAMVRHGLIDEARRLAPFRHCNALNTVGYKEAFRYIDGEWSLEQVIEKTARNTRVYAKKQLTWFGRDESIRWFSPADRQAVLDYAAQQLTQTP